MPNVKFEMDAESAKAVQGFLRIVEAQKKAEGQQVKVTKATKESDDMFTAFGKNAMSVAAGMVSGAGIISVFKMGLTALEGWDRHLKDMADKTRQIANDLMTFTLIQNPDRMPTASRDAVRAGASWGFDAASSLRIAQAAQSMYGFGAAGTSATTQMMHGIQAGIGEPDLINMLAAGKSKGVSPDKMIYDTFRAGKASGYTPAEIARVAPYLSGTDDLGLAMAMMPDFVDKFQRTFPEKYGQAMATTIKGSADPLWQKLGVKDGSQEQKIAALSAFAKSQGMSETGLQKFLMQNNISELSQNQGLAAMAMSYDASKARASEWAGQYSPAYVPGQLDLARRQDPKLFAAYERNRAEATVSYEEQFGKSGVFADLQAARDEKLRLGVLRDVGPFALSLVDVSGVGPLDRFIAGGATKDDELINLRMAQSGVLGKREKALAAYYASKKLKGMGIDAPDIGFPEPQTQFGGVSSVGSVAVSEDQIATLIKLMETVARNTSNRATAEGVSE